MPDLPDLPDLPGLPVPPGLRLPDGPVLQLVAAHGIGGAKDLPVPTPLAVVAGTAALVASFVVLVLAWRRPRYDAGVQGRPLPDGAATLVDSTGLAWTLRALGLVLFGYVTWAMLAGPDVVTNPTFGVFYVLVWVGIVPFSLLLGPVVRAVSPVRTLHLLLVRGAGGDPARGVLPYPARLGCWPAALGLFAFVWLELADQDSTHLVTVRLWLALYLAVMLVGAVLFGEEWFARADPFEVFSDLVAHLSPWGRRADGRLVVRSPLANLDGLGPVPGLVGVVAVLFGSTAFDSFKDTVRWVRLSDRLSGRLGSGTETLDTAALLVFCVLVGVTFTLAALLTGDTSSDLHLRRDLPLLLAPSVVPIIVGYVLAHYLSYFVEQGQATLIQLSDPLVRGQDLLGTADWSVSYALSFHPSLLAVLKVLLVVAGHVVGVVAAHDRALQVLPRDRQVTGQLGLLVVMVAYTGTGLFLLFGS